MKLKTILVSDEDDRVLMASLEHTAKRWDIPVEDRERAASLRERLREQFHAQ